MKGCLGGTDQESLIGDLPQGSARTGLEAASAKRKVLLKNCVSTGFREHSEALVQ